jgi:uncharacterized protein
MASRRVVAGSAHADRSAIMKYVLFYESAEDVAAKAPVHFAAHRARWAVFHERGSLLLVGPFSDGTGALGVFTTREAAEEFARDDPFVVHGVVRGWSIREWNEALSG